VQRLAATTAADALPGIWRQVADMASAYRQSGGADPVDYPVVFKSVLDGAAMPVAYVENRMWKDPATGSDEPSRYLDAIVKIMARMQPTDEVLIENAYMIMPTPILLGVMKALLAGQKVTLITNGGNITDNKTVTLFGRMQMEALLRFAKLAGKSANLVYIENHSDEQLHTKAFVLGDWLVIGSANADPRSAYLNTENGIVVAPGDVEMDGKTWPSAAAAFRDLALRTVAEYSQRKVRSRDGSTEDFVFQSLTLDQISARLDVPAGGDAGSRLKARLYQTFRNMSRNAMRKPPDKFGAVARQSLYEGVLIQF
jgi:phosphatidylserine/phosphatidylglycerophosphate/cardiolipin synthase-like enzyme